MLKYAVIGLSKLQKNGCSIFRMSYVLSYSRVVHVGSRQTPVIDEPTKKIMETFMTCSLMSQKLNFSMTEIENVHKN